MEAELKDLLNNAPPANFANDKPAKKISLTGHDDTEKQFDSINCAVTGVTSVTANNGAAFSGNQDKKPLVTVVTALLRNVHEISSPSVAIKR